MEAKSIERIAEELKVNFFDLAPLITARDEYMGQQGILKMVKLVTKFVPSVHKGNVYKDKVLPTMELGWEWRCDTDCHLCLWQDFLKSHLTPEQLKEIEL